MKHFLGKMVSTDVVMKVLVEVVVVEAADVVGVKVVIEVVVGVVMLTCWKWPVLREWVLELVVQQ